MTIDAPLDLRPAAIPAAPVNNLLTSPILPTLLKLALPNAIAMVGTALVAVAETSYIGRLGTEPLAGIALVFPFVMLTQMMSAGAMGGGVSSAISRALGAGNRDRAASLALHAAMIGTCAGLFFTVVMLAFGRQFYSLLGGRGGVLEQAMQYSHVLFSGAVSIWLVNTLASVVRGTGDMRIPSAVLIVVAFVQVVVGGGLGLGLFGLPKLGMPGVAAGQLTAFTLGAIFLAWYLASGRSRLKLNFTAFRFERDMFIDILKVGAISCLAPLQTVLTILIFTKIVAGLGTETLAGYGMGSRLEFLLVPIAFAFGIASVPMVGMAVGAGLVARARRVAWTAAAAAGLTVGLIGLVVAIKPTLWISLFTSDPGVTAAASSYLAWAGPAFGFFGTGLALYFASQGAAKVGGPVMAGTIRLLLVGLGGWWLASSGAPAWTLFALVGAAMVVYGLSTVLFIRFTRWGK
ncbi:MATE family efflux transporter [Bradyrhizobium sp. AUGA SZCCT0240]|uniref:MATE family efflux transporter n=1 Tax=unclassified Bradyrhizobium TaxID=2631580 RepID=UPI001BA83407|nr:MULTISPECIES: MATE family efflux transporter [unclassified Bradyrhizobium]MBR1199717.1 MATE family efflux transporter [Bradyrhizobium sp. AUGA SZCCT0158]MBR1243934.1 MATE family efflux transporter [Bradyrhizobium sp. AUGA SZCCT0274]MBR1257008.1 MATE family efflux transporter [Bradyrhizobium sp. AUGA SZCCT0240]